ncbi:unnamed protein product [Protopolystoma xenopodis]|uniref:DUF4200 domain-containing protein n=1 Tax=Protopolystoma xenopodis TaxID=117903 RepID=A0A448X3Y5_9PLAT|nr:unnamed protein product [Protopolystoma xenopodis]
MYKKYPDRDEGYLTSVTKLLEHRKEKQEVDNALMAQKEELKMKVDGLQQRWDELEQKEFQLKQSLLKFDRFLKDNDTKRSRAFKKMLVEKDLQIKKQGEISKLVLINLKHKRLLDDIASTNFIKSKLETKQKKYSIYHKFLESAVEISEYFSEIRELIDRYETLHAAYINLSERNKLTEENLEHIKINLHHFKSKRQDETFTFTNNLALFQVKYNNSQSSRRHKEQEWCTLRDDIAKKALDLGTLRLHLKPVTALAFLNI